MDPYSHELMITCTTPIFRNYQFIGVVTVDLTLAGLQSKIDTWQQKTGGYIFILDRNNQFMTFPDIGQVKRTYRDEAGKSLEKFVSIHEFVAAFADFSPFLEMVKEMDGVILGEAPKLNHFRADLAQLLPQQSPQFDEDEARLFTAIVSDPLDSGDRTDYLFQKYELEHDGRLQEPAIAFLFYVPQVYWKVFIVKPRSEIQATTHNLIQADKMATLGQMLVGVAHELSNPLNFMVGNLTHARHYITDLLEMLELYETSYPNPTTIIRHTAEQIDLKFLQQDLPKLMDSMKVGADRTFEIIKALKRFSRIDDEAYQMANLHEGLNGTLLLLNHRLKPQANQFGIQVIRDYGSLPPVQCLPGQVNQAFMNLLVNAIDALEAKSQEIEQSGVLPGFFPTIWISTHAIAAHGAEAVIPEMAISESASAVTKAPGATIQDCRARESSHIIVSIRDNGSGIPLAVQERLFTPFFTTKAPGQGTGLGLTICRQIITERHGGTLRFQSTPGEGTEFIMELPVQAEAMKAIA